MLVIAGNGFKKQRVVGLKSPTRPAFRVSWRDCGFGLKLRKGKTLELISYVLFCQYQFAQKRVTHFLIEY